MDLGEKLAVLQDLIYTNASQELQKAEVPPTLGRLVIEGVYSRFQQDAYTDCIIEQLKNESTQQREKEHISEAELMHGLKENRGSLEVQEIPNGIKHTGKAEDLLRQIAGGNTEQ